MKFDGNKPVIAYGFIRVAASDRDTARLGASRVDGATVQTGPYTVRKVRNERLFEVQVSCRAENVEAARVWFEEAGGSPFGYDQDRGEVK